MPDHAPRKPTVAAEAVLLYVQEGPEGRRMIEVDANGKPIPVSQLPDEYLDELAARMGWTRPADEAGREEQCRRVRRGLRMLRAEDRKRERSQERADSR